MTKKRDIAAYATTYSADYGFEAEMVHYRRKLVLDRLALHKPKTVIEVGCGPDLTVEAWAKAGGTWESWIIVEPAPAFAQTARARIAAAGLTGVVLKEAFFEEAGLNEAAPDLLLCAGLMHEVPSASALVSALTCTMGSNTILHVNVPNATSFHRRLAKAMGMVDDLATLSDRNRELDQRRVYDAIDLEATLQAGGLRVTEAGGILVKPFTHGQMEKAKNFLTRSVLDGLDILGRAHPDWASEIWAEAVRT
jgi:hypothetical protein